MIEKLLKDKTIEPYFLWLVKSRLKIAQEVMDISYEGKNIEVIHSANVACQEAYLMICSRLVEFDIQKDKAPIIISKISEYYMKHNTVDKLLGSNPELLIFPIHKSN